MKKETKEIYEDYERWRNTYLELENEIKEIKGEQFDE